jgi:hypothetical protein
MNNDLLKKVYEWVSSTAEKVGDWTAKEIPLFIQEFLTWRFWENAIGIFQYLSGCLIFGVIVFLICKFLIKPLAKLSKEHPHDGYDIGCFFTSLITLGVMCIFLFGWFPTDNIKNCIQIKVAPKVYLMEEAIKIAKTIK